MDEKQENEIKKVYNDIMNLTEIELYKKENVENIKLFKFKDSKKFFIQLCISNLKKSANILKHYILIILIHKTFEIENELIKNLNELYSIYEEDFIDYIGKLKQKKEDKNQEKDDKIMIDDIPHEIHIDIRIKFFEIILKNSNKFQETKEIIGFIINYALLSKKIFGIEDKKKFADFIFNKFSDKKEIIKDLILQIEKNNKNIFYNIDDVLFYEYIFLELNYIENLLQFKTKTENNKKIIYEILSINQDIKDLKHLDNYIIIFYIQDKEECINEMSNFLFKLFNFKNNIQDLFEINKKSLLEKENENAVKLYMYIIEETEKNYFSDKKSHSNLCKKYIFKILIKNNKNEEGVLCSLYFYGNTKLKEINNFLIKQYPDIYFEFNLSSKNQNPKELDEKDFNKTLNELKKEKTILKIYKKDIIADKLIENNKLTRKFKNLLKNWFKYFSKNKEIMDKYDTSVFLSKTTKKNFGPNSFKNLAFFRNNVPNWKNYSLKKEDLINFYYKKLKEAKIKDVWNNIKNMGYYPDLNKINIYELPNEIDNLNLRFCLSNNIKENKNNNFYLFDELREKYKNSLNEEIFNFFLFLSTNINIYNNVLNNFNYNQNMKFTNKIDEYIDNMYKLIIIESIFEDIQINELKEEEIYKNIEINSKRYIPFESDENKDKKTKFVVDYLNNNFNDLIDYITILLTKINENEKNGKNRLEIIIKCCLKGLEIVNNIYDSYFKINFERESEDVLLIRAPTKVIINNNLQNIIINNEKYNNLINQVLIFIDLHYLKYDSLNEKDIDKTLILLIQNCYYFLFSLLFTKNNTFNYINDNNENKILLKKIILNILKIYKKDKNKDYIRKLFFFKKENQISLLFLAYLIDLTFLMFEDENNIEELNNLLSKDIFVTYLINLCNYSINRNPNLIKNKLLNINEKTYNYINSKDINIYDDKESIYSNYLLILKKCFDKLNEENIKKEIIFNKINKQMTLYELLMKKLILEEENKIKKKEGEYSDLEILINNDKNNKYLFYEEVIRILNKIKELKKENNDKKEKKLVEDMISYCSWYLSLDNNKDKINDLITELNHMKKLEENKGDFLKIVDKKHLKKRKEYVGLKNLGNICYLISVIQQLFMIPQFRFLIMNIDDKKEKIKTEYLEDDNILHQLQRMFTYLLFSNFGVFIPKDFVYSIKEKNNEQMMTNMQKDSQEFFSDFCEKIEESIKNTNQKYLIQNLFLGKFCYVTKCPNCNNLSFRYDEFNCITLEVKDIKNIYESLNNYISPEKIDDYTCGNCNKKVTLSKRSLISELPNILIIHLQRILMNYEDNRIEKINSRFEFPKKLNLKNYCAENILNENEIADKNEIYKKKEEYYEYELRGINVQKGNADGGHYISIIKVIGENKNNSEDIEEKWYQFDDTRIKEFNIDNLEKECFGGKKDDSDEETNKSAYLLFYELSKKKPMKILLDENQKNDNCIVVDENNYNKYNITELNNNIDENDLTNKIFYNKNESNYYKYIPFDNIPKNINKEYLSEVIKDNKIYDYIYGNNRIIDFNNYLVQILLKYIEQDSFIIIDYHLDFEIYKKLIDILFSAIISFLSNEIHDDKNIKNVIIIIQKIIIPMINDEKNLLNNNQKLELINYINNNIFNISIIQLIFTNTDIKEIQKQFFELLKLIIKKSDEENLIKIISSIQKIINEGQNISIYLYEILYEFIQNKNDEKINTYSEIFMLLYYKLYKEKDENLNIIYKILKYLVYEKQIIRKEQSIITEIKSNFNDGLMINLFESSIDILILITEQLQYNDKKYSNNFNNNYIQK